MFNNYSTIARLSFVLIIYIFIFLFFIQRGPIHLIKHDSKDIIMLQKTYFKWMNLLDYHAKHLGQS